MLARPVSEHLIDLDCYPSGTSLRFRIIVLLAIVGSWSAGETYASYLIFLVPDSDAWQVMSWGGSIVLIFTLGLAYLLYCVHPFWLIKRDGLALIDKQKQRTLLRKVETLSEKIGVHTPQIMVSPYAHRQNAQLFGFGPTHTLRIDLGLVLLLRRAPEVFEAVILHELAHSLYGDVFKGYFSRAIYLTLIVVCTPLAVVAIGRFFILWIPMINVVFRSASVENLFFWVVANVFVFFQNMPFLFFLLLIGVEYAAIVRIREYYADWRAGQTGARDVLIKIFKLKLNSSEGFRSKRIFQKHPTAVQRQGFLLTPLQHGFDVVLFDFFLLSYIGASLLFGSHSLVSTLLAGEEPTSVILDQFFVSPNVNEFYLMIYLILLVSAFMWLSTYGSLIQRFAILEWLRPRGLKHIIIKSASVGLISALGISLATLLWPETISDYRFSSGKGLKHDFSWNYEYFNVAFTLGVVYGTSLACSMFVGSLATCFYLPRSDGARTPNKLFWLVNILILLVFNSVALSFTKVFDPDPSFVRYNTLVEDTLGFSLTELAIGSSVMWCFIISLAIWVATLSRSRVQLNGIPVWLEVRSKSDPTPESVPV